MTPIVSVSTKAETFDLTTIDKVKADLVIEDSDNDPELKRMIRSASKMIARHIGRILAKQTYVEKTFGYESLTLMLTNTPLISIDTIYIDGELVVDYEIQSAESGFVYRENAWQWLVADAGFLSSQPSPGKEYPKIVVTYDAGYILPGDSTGDTDLPEDIEEACIIVVKDLFQAKATYSGITMEKVGDLSVGYDKERGGLSNIVKDILEPYKRVM